MFSSIDPVMIRAIIPEIGLAVLALIVLVYDLIWRGEQKRGLGWLTAGGIAVVFVLTVAFSRPGEESVQIWGGMLRHDWLSFSFTLLFLFGAAITSLFAMEMKPLGQRGEFYLLLLISTIGMILMASSADLIMLFLAIETTSIPLYILAGFYKLDDKSTESGFKYFLFGAMTSAVMLYGFSLIYGFTGTTDIYEITEMVAAGVVPLTLAIGTLILIMVGFGFKISVVPFHFWAPDVYEGAPTPVAGFLSTASKAAGFAVLMRVLLTVYADPAVIPYWVIVVAALSVFSMTLGNALAIPQKNIKRLLAYSSIAHAGYALIGVASLSGSIWAYGCGGHRHGDYHSSCRQYRRGYRRAADQGHPAAFYQRRRDQYAAQRRRSRHSAQYRPTGKPARVLSVRFSAHIDSAFRKRK